MATKLYVGNLPFQTTSDDLREHFAKAGNVESAQIVEDRMTGRSRGFGFVEMTTAEEAAAAIEQFNGKDFNGRDLTVNEARPRTDRGGGGGYGGGGGGGGNRGGYGGGGYGGGGGGGRRDKGDRDRGPSRNDREPRW
ncbi:MAG TPA: RNA-binding protein [Pyrinomonadaceae bacterium]|nr:RNA-binding protein [Pyrinomonadaceae bacterium]